MTTIAILAIHGMGNQKTTYYDNFDRKIEKALKQKSLIKNQDYFFKGFRYSSVFENRGEQVEALVKNLDWQNIRRFVINYLGDALAYQHGIPDPNRLDHYRVIHDKLMNELKEWGDEIGEDTPILVIAHSLGAYIISNYVWDAQKSLDNDFKSMSTLCGMITLGCNIPILTLGFNPNTMWPITLPGSKIIDGDHIKWMNYYDKDDVLGMPIKTFYTPNTPEQHKTVEKIEDKTVNAGSFFLKWTPFSHSAYWTDKNVIKGISDQIQLIIENL